MSHRLEGGGGGGGGGGGSGAGGGGGGGGGEAQASNERANAPLAGPSPPRANPSNAIGDHQVPTN